MSDLIFETTPNEILVQILDYLEGNEIVGSELVCKHFQLLIRNNSWTKKTISIYGVSKASQMKHIVQTYKFHRYNIHPAKNITTGSLRLLIQPLNEYDKHTKIEYGLIDLSNCINIGNSINDSKYSDKKKEILSLIGNSFCEYFHELKWIIQNFEEVNLSGCYKIENEDNDDDYYTKLKCRSIDISGCVNLSKRFLKLVRPDIKINISECTKLYPNYISYLQKCKTVIMRNCIQITDYNLQWLKDCETVDVSGCKEISDYGIKYLKNCKEVRASGCSDITDNGLASLSNCQTIDLSHCHRITGCVNLNSVKNISLAGCYNLKDTSLCNLKNCKYVNLTGCELITNEGLSNLSDCIGLNISNCPLITDEGIVKLKCKIVVLSKKDIEEKYSKEALEKLSPCIHQHL